MSSQLSLENFEEIYNNTYTYTLRYILCKCSNIDDVNDLLQETYVELYKILKTKKKYYIRKLSELYNRNSQKKDSKTLWFIISIKKLVYF